MDFFGIIIMTVLAFLFFQFYWIMFPLIVVLGIIGYLIEEGKEANRKKTTQKARVDNSIRRNNRNFVRSNNIQYEDDYSDYEDDYGGSWNPEKGGTYGDESFDEWLESNSRD